VEEVKKMSREEFIKRMLKDERMKRNKKKTVYMEYRTDLHWRQKKGSFRKRG